MTDRNDIEAMAKRVEAELRSLVQGEFSSIHLSWNDESGPNFMTVAADEERDDSHADWVSEEERQKGMAENSKWILQWYQQTPVGFHAVAASSLPALCAALRARAAEGEG